LFEGNITTKPDKAQLVAELEKHLIEADKQFSSHSMHNTHAVIDCMSGFRNIPSDKKTKTFAGLISCSLSLRRDCALSITDIVCDSYIEKSLKEGEHIRRACPEGTVEVADILEDTPIPKLEAQFWAESLNKENLQLLARTLALRDMKNVIVSGMVVNNELIAPKPKENDCAIVDVPELSSWLEEADSRIVPLINWSVEDGCQRMHVYFDDTDTVCFLLRYISTFQKKGVT